MRSRILPALLLAFSAGLGHAADFTLSSADVAPQARIGRAFVYDELGCAGGNRSPALQWRDAPAGTAGFAVTVFDPDAGSGGWWHWLVVDLPAQAAGLPADASRTGLPAPARQLRNDFGRRGYGGPCPPPGQPPHRYVFTVYALKSARLDLPEAVDGAGADAAIRQQALGAASFTALYGR
ncbi:MAG: YbhB/YbcL family Raf kinase inhibitor-like protein [Nevskia sp.]|nr:YbhB/YbcL family Raf kinase inhibitor-like protein [Nevskia sp.]